MSEISRSIIHTRLALHGVKIWTAAELHFTPSTRGLCAPCCMAGKSADRTTSHDKAHFVAFSYACSLLNQLITCCCAYRFALVQSYGQLQEPSLAVQAFDVCWRLGHWKPQDVKTGNALLNALHADLKATYNRSQMTFK